MRQGDDDPIDTIDLTTVKRRKILDVNKLKVLGSFCLIDEGELDWKVFVMDRQEANNSNVIMD
jgi:inorganic pyrophosphatase